MDVLVTENAGEFSSAAKGETLEHTIRTIAGFRANAIVLRHKDEGAADRAAAVVDKYGLNCHIINAGDGPGQHPTQSLIDLYAIIREKGRPDNLSIAIGGDLRNSRTTHSLAYLLSKFSGIKIYFVSPLASSMKKEVLEHLIEHSLPFVEIRTLAEVDEPLDVIYWVRVQREYALDQTNPALGDVFCLTAETLEKAGPECILLHPMPIVDEIAQELDDHPRSAYFRQAEGGLYLRMALLDLLINQE